MSITKRSFGKAINGTEVSIFTLTNSNNMVAEITNFGGIVLSVWVPDSRGKLDDVVLGYDRLESYMINKPNFGGIIGRFGNRIENGCFELNGKEYKLAQNDGKHHLHGGIVGFNKVVWKGNVISGEGFDSLELTYTSRDGEEGYPGNLDVKVTYTLTKNNALEIHYFAVSDKDTVINLTNHSYFNLSGHAAGDILKHKVMINANKFTVNDEYSIPTGEIRDVKGTPMDFMKLTEIGSVIESEYDQIKYAKGYDQNWILNVSGKSPEMAAQVYDENSGRLMEVYTTKPGVQLYTGNFLDGTDIGKGDNTYAKRSGLCLETQFFPNSIKHKHFPTPILRAGNEYKHMTIYKFSTK